MNWQASGHDAEMIGNGSKASREDLVRGASARDGDAGAYDSTSESITKALDRDSESITKALDADSESITKALDDAVAKLQAAARVGMPAEAEQPQPPTPLEAAYVASTVALVDGICQAGNRRGALESMARLICPPQTSGHVRAGLGGKQLRWLYDSKLGWMGSDSRVFETCKSDFSAIVRGEGEQRVEEGTLASIKLPQPKGGGNCVLWIDNDRAAVSWIHSVHETVTNVFWSRPHHSLPTWMSAMAARTKSWILVIVVGLALLSVWPARYRIACEATVETSGQRFIATPFEASLKEVFVRPGDQVEAGQVLLVLDGRPLRLEQESLQAELQQAAKEEDVARSSRRIADAQQIALKQRKLQRKIDLIESRLQNLNVVSPISGLIVSGDLQRNIGMPLERGQTLMEVAAMEEMIIELQIPEHEIGFATEGMETRIKIDAIGGSSMFMPLDEIFPAAEVREDKNVFVGRMKVGNQDGALRPGMRGEATAYGPMRPWIWSWTRSWVERAMWWIGY
ncbi:HlyD family secretion protein [Rubripirellula amarantea]|uniref:HlyD family secretion protein n=1 Tax=Rubripirellula amarantea TaxID=2527999 RepID=A0A5C5WHX6_9BACT|nr:efflux RND transporter periplasmic adaptor subunit [Rubripirellula amarantea]TWT50167.1 HlyD family secretion protein [Rubripirellula amarantea]